MIKHGRFYFPDGDNHFAMMLNTNGYYQEDTFNTALKYCKAMHCFVDIGAHVGMWTTKAVDSGFRHIVAFEPVPEHIECFRENTKDLNADIELYPVMLGNGGYGKMENFIAGNSGALRVTPLETLEPGGERIMKLDDVLNASIFQVDLVKIDVEGFEKLVLEGGVAFLKRTRPVIIVEQKSNKDAIAYLTHIGARLVDSVRKDYIFAW